MPRKRPDIADLGKKAKNEGMIATISAVLRESTNELGESACDVIAERILSSISIPSAEVIPDDEIVSAREHISRLEKELEEIRERKADNASDLTELESLKKKHEELEGDFDVLSIDYKSSEEECAALGRDLAAVRTELEQYKKTHPVIDGEFKVVLHRSELKRWAEAISGFSGLASLAMDIDGTTNVVEDIDNAFASICQGLTVIASIIEAESKRGD